MTYLELRTAIQNTIESTETSFVAQIPFMVTRAEQRIYREAYLPDGKKTTTGTMATGTNTITLPTDFLQPVDFSITVSGANKLLLFKDRSYIREVWPTPSTTGEPRYYSFSSATTFLVAPTPNSNFAYTIDYYGFGATIVGVDGNTSWLGDNAEEVLLYASLYEAAIYNKAEQDLLVAYKQQYTEALANLKNEAELQDTRDAYQDGVPRMAP